jgi:DNA-binding response OmpR family regulator
MARILVVEDNADLAYGLQRNLEYEGHDVTVEGNGQRGLVRARHAPPDLIVLDLMLPGLDGFAFLQTLRTNKLTMPVLILTARGEEADKVRGLRLGADDYVTKPFGVMELLARVDALLRRSHGFDDRNRANTPHHLGDLTIDPRARSVTRRGSPLSLTPKEFDLLLALIERAGAVASRLELMRQVWGYSAAVVSRTVDTHIAELRRKIEDDPSNPRYVITVRKAGYRIDPGVLEGATNRAGSA